MSSEGIHHGGKARLQDLEVAGYRASTLRKQRWMLVLISLCFPSVQDVSTGVCYPNLEIPIRMCVYS